MSDNNSKSNNNISGFITAILISGLGLSLYVLWKKIELVRIKIDRLDSLFGNLTKTDLSLDVELKEMTNIEY